MLLAPYSRCPCAPSPLCLHASDDDGLCVSGLATTEHRARHRSHTNFGNAQGLTAVRKDGGAMSSQPLPDDLLTEVAYELRRLRQLFENQVNESPFLDLQAAALFLRTTPESVRYWAERRRLLPYYVQQKG